MASERSINGTVRSAFPSTPPSHLIWFGVPFRSNDTNRADLQQRLQRVGSPTMFHDATAYNAIYVDCSDFHGFACRPHAEPGPQMGALRCHLSHDPLPFSNLPIDRQVKVRVSPPHT